MKPKSNRITEEKKYKALITIMIEVAYVDAK